MEKEMVMVIMELDIVENRLLNSYHFPLLIKKGRLYMVLDYRMIMY